MPQIEVKLLKHVTSLGIRRKGKGKHKSQIFWMIRHVLYWHSRVSFSIKMENMEDKTYDSTHIFLKGLSAMMECASKENNNGKEDKIFVEICLMG